MRMVFAVVVCVVEVFVYGTILKALGLMDLHSQPSAYHMPMLLARLPLLLLIGLTWSAITGRSFPNWLDPLGLRKMFDEPVVNTPVPVVAVGEPRKTGAA